MKPPKLVKKITKRTEYNNVEIPDTTYTKVPVRINEDYDLSKGKEGGDTRRLQESIKENQEKGNPTFDFKFKDRDNIAKTDYRSSDNTKDVKKGERIPEGFTTRMKAFDVDSFNIPDVTITTKRVPYTVSDTTMVEVPDRDKTRVKLAKKSNSMEYIKDKKTNPIKGIKKAQFQQQTIR